MPNNMLLKQTYPGKNDCNDHFYSLLDAFRDKRYLTVKGKHLFFIFNPQELKQQAGYFCELWQELAKKEGLSNVFVTNGYISPEALKEIGPYLDAANVDLKSFNDTEIGLSRLLDRGPVVLLFYRGRW